MDNLTQLKGNWKEIKEKLKQKFGLLTESDLLFAEGKQDEMLTRLQTKLGRTKTEVYKIISEL
ncbi:MAG: CsbD family protein [Ferruginibacter sp.]